MKTAISGAGYNPETPELDKTLLAAEERLALDEGRPIPLEQLAALANIGMKSIRNAAAPSSGSGLEVKDGAATPESATRWLIARDFKNSIWSRAGEEEDQEEVVVERQPEVEGEIFWLPFASDGSEFHPETCLQGGGYRIGPKGAKRRRSKCTARHSTYWRGCDQRRTGGVPIPRVIGELSRR